VHAWRKGRIELPFQSRALAQKPAMRGWNRQRSVQHSCGRGRQRYSGMTAIHNAKIEKKNFDGIQTVHL
jgi:hypothetical protein